MPFLEGADLSGVNPNDINNVVSPQSEPGRDLIISLLPIKKLKRGWSLFHKLYKKNLMLSLDVWIWIKELYKVY